MRRSPTRCTADELAARIWLSAQSARPCRKALPAGRAFAWLSDWVWVIPIAVLAFGFLLFAAGRLRSRRWRPAA
jgi:Flp pilus assembly protein protease CpaA